MGEPSEKAITLNVQLTSGTAADQPVMASYTAVNVAPGVVYVDFEFIEPDLFGSLTGHSTEQADSQRAYAARVGPHCADAGCAREAGAATVQMLVVSRGPDAGGNP